MRSNAGMGPDLLHSSPTITLSTDAHLMPADREVARAVLYAALAPAAEDSLRTSEFG